ncbi:MAG: Flp pilus assembly protein CpaB [Acidimicrobiia bacterium]
MRRSPRSVVASCAAIAVAALTAIVVAQDLTSLHRRAREFGPPREVVVAARDLPLGAKVAASDLDTVTRSESEIPPDAVGAGGDAIGRVVAVPVLEGSVLFAGHLAPADRDGLDGLVAAGSRAVRIQPADGLQPPIGAVVDVLVALDPAYGGGGRATIAARAARVLAVDAADANDPTASGTAGVTLLVTEEEARELAFATANGVVTLALAPPEAACCPLSGS